MIARLTLLAALSTVAALPGASPAASPVSVRVEPMRPEVETLPPLRALVTPPAGWRQSEIVTECVRAPCPQPVAFVTGPGSGCEAALTTQALLLPSRARSARALVAAHARGQKGIARRRALVASLRSGPGAYAWPTAIARLDVAYLFAARTVRRALPSGRHAYAELEVLLSVIGHDGACTRRERHRLARDARRVAAGFRLVRG